MAKQTKHIARYNRDMLYAMAAVASFGEGTEIVVNFDSYDPEKGTLVFAMAVRDNAPTQRTKDRHKNGWAYYLIGKNGRPIPLTEKELKQRG